VIRRKNATSKAAKCVRRRTAFTEEIKERRV